MTVTKTYTHPSNLDASLVQKVASRRGKLHAFETLDPQKTALVVIDMMVASVEGHDDCLNMIEPINQLASVLRAHGGSIAWVTQAPDSNGKNMAAIVGEQIAERFIQQSDIDNGSSQLWPELDAYGDDIHVKKQGFSAFFPGKCELHTLLQNLDIDTILIAGTVTNICCESSARDAYEHGYKVTMISDCNAGHSFGLHEASLNNFYRIFGDVRPSTDVMELIIQK